MKKKNLFIVLATLSFGIVFSCNNNSKEIEMQSKIDSLQEILHSKGIFNLHSELFSRRFFSRDSAKKYADSFRYANSLSIPLAIRFDSDDLDTIISNHPYVRFYFGVKPNTDHLTLIAVGVDSQNRDNDKELTNSGGDTYTNMYEFADPCPPCNINGYNQPDSTLLNPGGAQHYYIFRRLE